MAFNARARTKCHPCRSTRVRVDQSSLPPTSSSGSALITLGSPDPLHRKRHFWAPLDCYDSIMKRWPISSFFVLAFVITWAVWLPRALDIDWALGVGTFWTYGPAAAAVVTAFLVGGRRELRQLLSGIDKWRIGWAWYTVILLGPLALGLLVATVNLALGGRWENGLPEVFSEPIPIVLLLLVILTLTDGLGEELGWRGFALPRMLERQNAFAASILLGIVWAIWHLPLLGTDGSALDGTYFWLLIARLPATAVLYTWVYQHTNGSVAAAVIFHGSLNLFSIAPPTPGDPLTPAIITLVSHWLIALVLVAFAGSRRLDGFPRQQVEPTVAVSEPEPA